MRKRKQTQAWACGIMLFLFIPICNAQTPKKDPANASILEARIQMLETHLTNLAVKLQELLMAQPQPAPIFSTEEPVFGSNANEHEKKVESTRMRLEMTEAALQHAYNSYDSLMVTDNPTKP